MSAVNPEKRVNYTSNNSEQNTLPGKLNGVQMFNLLGQSVLFTSVWRLVYHFFLASR